MGGKCRASGSFHMESNKRKGERWPLGIKYNDMAYLMVHFSASEPHPRYHQAQSSITRRGGQGSGGGGMFCGHFPRLRGCWHHWETLGGEEWHAMTPGAGGPRPDAEAQCVGMGREGVEVPGRIPIKRSTFYVKDYVSGQGTGTPVPTCTYSLVFCVTSFTTWASLYLKFLTTFHDFSHVNE